MEIRSLVYKYTKKTLGRWWYYMVTTWVQISGVLNLIIFKIKVPIWLLIHSPLIAREREVISSFIVYKY